MSVKPQSPSYGNFADPLGLVWRMISQGGSIGWWSLASELASKMAIPLDFAMQPFEKRCLAARTESDTSVLLVVGPPRSGSTLVHQLLAHCLDVSYFSNMNSVFGRSPITAAKWFQPKCDPGKLASSSLYGNTYGLRGVNDGFHVWDKFLGDDRYGIDHEKLAENHEQLEQFINAWVSALKKPLLNKNNRNTVAIDALSQAIPRARFVVVIRDPFFVAQSILKARKWVQGDSKIGWGLNSKTVADDTDELSYVDAVCDQVVENEENIDRQCEIVSDDRLIRLQYDDVCENPEAVIRTLCDWDSQLKLRPGRDIAKLPSFTPSRKVTVSDQVANRIRDRLSYHHREKQIESTAV